MERAGKSPDVMDQQPFAHGSVQATQMKTEANRPGPLVKRNPRSDAVRAAKAKISRRRSLQKQRDARKNLARGES
jgi:hypothetical protein